MKTRGKDIGALLDVWSLHDLERDVPELRRGAGRRRRSSGLAEAQGVDEASQCVQ